MEKLERVKGLLEHQLKDLSYGALPDTVSDLAIQRYDPRKKSARPSQTTKPAVVTPA